MRESPEKCSIASSVRACASQESFNSHTHTHTRTGHIEGEPREELDCNGVHALTYAVSQESSTTQNSPLSRSPISFQVSPFSPIEPPKQQDSTTRSQPNDVTSHQVCVCVCVCVCCVCVCIQRRRRRSAYIYRYNIDTDTDTDIDTDIDIFGHLLSCVDYRFRKDAEVKVDSSCILRKGSGR